MPKLWRIIRRHHIIYFMCISLGLFFLDQLYLQYKLSQPQTPFALSLYPDDVRMLMRASREIGVEVVLFDPVIIQAFHNNAHIVNNPTACVFLCHVVGPLIFAAKFNSIEEKPMFVARLAQLGFTVTQFSNSENKRSHIFLLRKGSPLHIVLLHWEEAGYYRQYQVTGPPQRLSQLKQYITKDTWRMLSSDRVYRSKSVMIDSVKLPIPSHVNHFLAEHNSAKFLPCNVTRANYFKLKYPTEVGTTEKEFVHKSFKIVDRARIILDSLGIPFWLSSGTLLGYYRQCNIFPWAEDVDLGIFIEDYDPHIIEEFEKHGLKLKHRFGKISDSFELSFVLRGIKLDLFFFYTDGAVMWNGSCNRRGEKFKYIFSAFTLCWTDFLGMLVRVPCQTEEYIVANYGPNWFTPQKMWSYSNSPPNVHPNGKWKEEEWPEVLQIKQV